MDIATTPITPDGNPELADAAPTPHEPPVIRREDYQPFPWLVPTTQLDFRLGLEATTVTATLQVERNPAAAASRELCLNGDSLTAQSVTVDGAPAEWRMDGPDLIVTLPGEAHSVTIVTRIDPSANTQLMGLYASNGMLCTQCESEGFRRITFFPDRPDVLSTYAVRMEGDANLFPILLCNGNRTNAGENGDGTHWAEWHDPWPKPSYLFALVAGDLVANSKPFVTVSGREVECNVWVRAEDLTRTDHALESLHRSMKWDEDVFGREYDLDLYNIVAVSDFNMGAMENKGLNVFNTKYVLADPDTATDADFDAVEGVIAHEYFHNWSGNRITCRDWFQLSLKEGFTVLRDQLFSQDMRGEAVKRIEDVRILRAAQFPEDSGPLAHPIRPDSYREISNFYTATVYNKGAEVIRMMRSMVGVERFRAGTDLYFDRHDGEAATCEDFIKAIEDGAGIDLAQFRRWYSQAGTPRVTVSQAVEGDTLKLTLKQTVPVTPGQPDKLPMPIPLRVAVHSRGQGALGEEQLIVLTDEEQSFSLPLTGPDPVVSINRGFTAPVVIERALQREDLVFLAAHDDDPFARSEALQELAVSHLVGTASGSLAAGEQAAGEAAIIGAFRSSLADNALDDAMRGELMVLPSETYLFEVMATGDRKADPGAIHTAREGLKAAIGTALADELNALHARASAVTLDDPAGRGARKVKTIALGLIAAADPARAAHLAAAQYDAADNMTDRQGALMVLCGLDGPEREAKLADFYARYRDNALVVDKWFTLQALSLHPDVIAHVRQLAEHPDFTMKNPNRVRSLHMAFAGNPKGFHKADGEGYRMVADVILALDPINPQTAARFVPALGRWRRIEPGRAALMKGELERIMAAGNLSRDTFEQVSRSLEG
ncbi:aminopeptidase N [Erythromicrobium ramosum]|uniref:Aminopeptidase N n=1 Tax=Erythrobacter ramosus TaxID=35811 RepID=A0A6I4UJF5_9SPHN|nr:aminopeptidase N [Erythrobacter ramosus]MBB3774920.1 aminopeptidase N [Erythrobacter ramosus]MXP37439.1 aminopeptidase N [Erythrobacter ramosus]